VTAAVPSARVLIGGVGYRWDGDRSFGLLAADALARESWPPEVRVEDLGYGAIYVALDLADARPQYDRLILIAGVQRGSPRVPGELYVEQHVPAAPDDDELQARICEAGAGVLDVDHLLVIARHFGGLPDDVVRIELEPADDVRGDRLSAAAAARLVDARSIARREALQPLGELASAEQTCVAT
jgi:Ni,Fe-hydrogenase maturation factor